MADSSFHDISKMKVAELKKELKSRGLTTIGNKTELMDRLQTAMENENGKIDTLSPDELMDDVLNDEDLDDDIDDVDAEKSLDIDSAIIGHEDVTLAAIHVKTTATALKRKSSPEEKCFVKTVPMKKIVLNRALSNNSVSSPAVVTASGDVSVKHTLDDKAVHVEAVSDVAGKDADAKHVIKLSTLTPKERLEMRAKKFGLPASTDLKKEARIERFGGAITAAVTTPTTPSTPAKIGSVHTKIDVLKKRAERFGGSVSTVMSKLDLQERLEKRKARFGGPGGATAPKKGTVVN